MKLLLTILAFSLTIHLGIAQEEDGPYKAYFDNGQLKTEGQYENKKRIGEWKSYYDNGQLQSEYSYTDGKHDKDYTSYYKSGALKKKTQKEDGIFLTKGYYETGELLYQQLPENGYYKEYLKDGKLIIEANYKDYQLSGEWKRFYDNGTTEWIVTYKDGYREGVYKKFDENNQLIIEGQNLEDKKNNEELRYAEEGLLMWKGYYKDGLFNKTWTKFDANGKKIEKIRFREGLIGDVEVNFSITPTEVPDGVLEKVPEFPGCKNALGNKGKKRCMSENISRFIAKKFDIDAATRNGIKGKFRIDCSFIIDKMGYVTKIKAKSKYPVLEDEAIRAINLLPILEPGTVRGEAVSVPYTLPIVFQVL